MPDTKLGVDRTVFDRELGRLLDVEPRVVWGEQPPAVRVQWRDVILIHILIGAGLVAIGAFLWWFFGEDRIGTPWLYWPLTAMFLFTLILTVYEWFCYLGVRPRQCVPPPGTLSVDVLTTWCPGEPREMVVATLKSIQRISYPHRTYLCDEGDDPLLRAVCEKLGVRHMTRADKQGAKAGNINNALSQATGEVAVIMDPDHEAAPFFLDRVLGYFRDPKVGFVQSVQGYYNQSESLIARGAAEQTYHFYGPLMTGMDHYGTTQAIGANCAFRRAALDEIGGHATGLAEDMHTTLKLYAAGWRSVYLPEILTRGLVPNTFAAYAKQQLKWACGVWDILIETFWRVAGNLSWARRWHFLHNGLFYLRGLFVLFGALIPILALVSGYMPWKITILEFLQWYGPVLVARILVRQTAQRWLAEPSERGFQLLGGFLMNATWWVHLTGAICSMLRIRIPYIPTPKNDAAADAWWLSAPNIVLAVASVLAVIYGLSWDWSPFAALMAAFALINAVVFGFISVAAQQRTMARLRSFLGNGWRRGVQAIGRMLSLAGEGLCWVLRRQAALLVVLMVGGTVTAELMETTMTPLERLWAEMENRTEKARGGFLLGAYIPEADTAYGPEIDVGQAMAEVVGFEEAIDMSLSVVSIYQPWGPRALSQFPMAQLEAIRTRGAIPMITWEPLTHTFPQAAEDPELAGNRRVFAKISAGVFDDFLMEYAIRIREHGGPVMIRFAHEPDNPAFVWSSAGGNTPEAYIAAWRYIVGFFDGMGATNATWVWSPWKPGAVESHYPGDNYVDWIGLTILNYGILDGMGSWNSFAELYQPFYAKLWQRPVPTLIAELGSTDFGGSRAAWLADALREIAERSEIGGAVFFESGRDLNWPLDWNVTDRDSPIDWRIASQGADLAGALQALSGTRPMRGLTNPVEPLERMAAPNPIEPVPGGWQLTVDGRPFFVRGVAYGVGHGWRSGQQVNRRMIEEDFAAIAEMGANTVRRYAASWADTNILRAAQANDLKVMMGFWLDPEIDYSADARALGQIEAQVADTVRRWRDHPAVLSWGIGNETWGQLKHHHAQPRLTEMRRAYLVFVERLARLVKDIDPKRPVMTSLEYSSELPGALVALGELAPSIDAVGINAYYDSHLARLDHLVDHFGKGMPWFLSEFGPDGYWDQVETTWSKTGFAVEPTEAEKVAQYTNRWQKYVADTAPRSLGGVAFAWSDRLEGSITWFGLTDFQRRRKPAYHALRTLWTGEKSQASPLPEGLSVSVGGEAFEAGSEVSATVSAEGWPASCEMEWRLVEEAGFETVHRQAGDCRPSSWAFRLPDGAGRYRLFVTAGGGDDVTTASIPLLLR